MSKTNKIFQPMYVGDVHIKNRIAMAPMTRSRAGEDGVPKAMHAEYYAQRASAGLLITEGVNISPQGRGYAGTPGIWNEQQVQGWMGVTKAVYKSGGKIFMQLWHVGRLSHVDLQPDGASPVAPSSLRAGGTVFTENGAVEPSIPRALATEEIKDIVNQYRHAAELAKKAKLDGVEIHAANGYLLDQFLRDSTNKREDQYGGSAENRARLVLEVTQAVVNVWGAGRVGIRLSPISMQLGETPLDSDVMATYGYLIEKLNEFGLAYLHFVEGTPGGARTNPDGVNLDALRRKFKGLYIGNNGYDLNLANKRIENGEIDIVAFGRPFTSNPDLVERLRDGIALVEPDGSTFYGTSEKGLTDWPAASR